MDIVLKIAGVLALISLTALCLVGITVVTRIVSFFDLLSRDIQELKSKAVTSLDSLDKLQVDFHELKDRMSTTLENTDRSLDSVTRLTDKVNHEVSKIAAAVQPLQAVLKDVSTKVADPIRQGLTLVNGITKGFNAVKDKIFK